ncbi:hypothetical protein BT63DRAFT_421143, partial [Microthyrium microscopicum]
MCVAVHTCLPLVVWVSMCYVVGFERDFLGVGGSVAGAGLGCVHSLFWVMILGFAGD